MPVPCMNPRAQSLAGAMPAARVGRRSSRVLQDGLRQRSTILPFVARRLFRLAGSAKAGAGVAADTGKRSYSDHDTQKCCIAGADRNDSDDGSFSVDIRLQLPQCPAGLGSCGNAVLITHLCIWLLQCGCVFLRVPPGAVVVIAAYSSPLRLASSPEYRRCGRSLRTAMPSAFFCPTSTTS